MHKGDRHPITSKLYKARQKWAESLAEECPFLDPEDVLQQYELMFLLQKKKGLANAQNALRGRVEVWLRRQLRGEYTRKEKEKEGNKEVVRKGRKEIPRHLLVDRDVVQRILGNSIFGGREKLRKALYESLKVLPDREREAIQACWLSNGNSCTYEKFGRLRAQKEGRPSPYSREAVRVSCLQGLRDIRSYLTSGSTPQQRKLDKKRRREQVKADREREKLLYREHKRLEKERRRKARQEWERKEREAREKERREKKERLRKEAQDREELRRQLDEKWRRAREERKKELEEDLAEKRRLLKEARGSIALDEKFFASLKKDSSSKEKKREWVKKRLRLEKSLLWSRMKHLKICLESPLVSDSLEKMYKEELDILRHDHSLIRDLYRIDSLEEAEEFFSLLWGIRK